jgi:hypothetical protein
MEQALQTGSSRFERKRQDMLKDCGGKLTL